MYHGDRNLPGGTNYVGLTMLNIGECGRAFCGKLIGGKESGKMCVEDLNVCKIKCHCTTQWYMTTRSLSKSSCHVFIDVNRDDKYQVWIGVNVPFENISAQWDILKDNKRSMTEWSSFFVQLGVSEVTVENIKNTLNIASSATEEIIEFGVVSPKKRSHSEVGTLSVDTPLL